MARSVKNLTVERLREVLDYDPETGVFRWKAKTAKGTKIGAVAGEKPAKNGYRYISLDRVDHLAQRLAWMYVHGRVPDGYLRFANDDVLDCRIQNLVETKHNFSRNGFDHRTKEGRAAYLKAYRAANPERLREFDLRKTFDIGLTEYQEMFEAQSGVCAICKRPEASARAGKGLWLAVDHDHETGAVRGLLCSNCNRGLGCFGDDVGRMQAAISYLNLARTKSAASLETGDTS